MDSSRPGTPFGRSSRHELARYVLWQVPGWLVAGMVALGVATLLGVSMWWVAVAVAVFVVKDVVMFPTMRAAFRLAPSPGLTGRRGVVVEPLEPAGYVRVNGELWRAETSGDRIGAGLAVVVRDIRGLTLVVERAAEHRADGAG